MTSKSASDAKRVQAAPVYPSSPSTNLEAPNDPARLPDIRIAELIIKMLENRERKSVKKSIFVKETLRDAGLKVLGQKRKDFDNKAKKIVERLRKAAVIEQTKKHIHVRIRLLSDYKKCFERWELHNKGARERRCESATLQSTVQDSLILPGMEWSNTLQASCPNTNELNTMPSGARINLPDLEDEPVHSETFEDSSEEGCTDDNTHANSSFASDLNTLFDGENTGGIDGRNFSAATPHTDLNSQEANPISALKKALESTARDEVLQGQHNSLKIMIEVDSTLIELEASFIPSTHQLAYQTYYVFDLSKLESARRFLDTQRLPCSLTIPPSVQASRLRLSHTIGVLHSNRGDLVSLWFEFQEIAVQLSKILGNEDV